MTVAACQHCGAESFYIESRNVWMCSGCGEHPVIDIEEERTMKTAVYRTVGDSCDECGSNLQEVQDGPNKDQLFCLGCMNELPEAEFVEQMTELLEYEEEA